MVPPSPVWNPPPLSASAAAPGAAASPARVPPGGARRAAAVAGPSGAGGDPAALERLGRGVGVLPVAGEHGVALREHLAGLAAPQPGPPSADAAGGQRAAPP